MRSMRLSAVALMLCWLGNAFAAVQPVELKVKDEVVLAKAMEDGAGLTLPEFLVFTKSGAAVLHERAFNDSFVDRLELAVRSAEPLETEVTLAAVLEDIVAMDDSPLAPDIGSDYHFVFVEYWAEWCAPCHMQKKAVTEYFERHPDANVLWLYVRRDPTLLPNVTVTK